MRDNQSVKDNDRSVIERIFALIEPALTDSRRHFLVLLTVSIGDVDEVCNANETWAVPFEEHRACVWRSWARELEYHATLLELGLF
ncbi:hypothetical protein O8B93_18515 [Agrobacterium rhizogenes]|uniref:hypothetical protein n=1 Tax=Rhizobium rhizogenes TaxID=359 RepID=UPI0022B614CB|nr:hypothetical protein [Rhizobium rhizogenes]MCZ7449584.1 hypothetical protein [Rhizobium rhizogenes]